MLANLANLFKRLVVVCGLAFGGGSGDDGGDDSGGCGSGGGAAASGDCSGDGSGGGSNGGPTESSHTGDMDLFDDENEEVNEEDFIDLSTSDVAPGRSFPSKTVAMKSLKEFYKKNYHPLISVSTFIG